MPKDPRKEQREEELKRRIDRMINPQNYADGVVPDWSNITKEDEGYFTIEDLISMKPFRVEDLNTTIAFRANDKVLRATQRIKEKAAGSYDIISDLHRDVYMLGLIIMTQRYEDILGGEIIIERAQSRVRMIKDIEDQVRRLGAALLQEPEEERRTDYFAFIEMMRKKPYKIQLQYTSAMERNALLAELRHRMVEQAKKEEEE